MRRTGRLLLTLLILLAFTTPAPPRIQAADKAGAGPHGPAASQGGKAMEAQHRRMITFRNAMRALSDALIFGNLKNARANTEKLAEALNGYDQDVPHKNRDRLREFYELYVNLDGEIQKLQLEIKADDLSDAATAYGKILEVCVTCHKEFRD